MTFLSRAQIVKTALPHRVTRPGSDWRVCDSSIEAAIDEILDALGGGSGTRVHWYKQTEKKWIFRLANGDVVKAMYLHTLPLRLKYRRYARDEAANLIWAASKGIHVPSVHGIGARRSRAGLVDTAVLMLDELAGMRTVTELLQEAGDEMDRISAVLRATIPVFERLHQSGCNHIDLNAGNILLDPRNLQATPAVIDFKYALFHQRPSLEILMLEAARFGRDCTTLVPAEAVRAWFESLLDHLSVENERQREWCRRRFDCYLHVRLSRKDRQRVNPYPAREAEHFTHVIA